MHLKKGKTFYKNNNFSFLILKKVKVFSKNIKKMKIKLRKGNNTLEDFKISKKIINQFILFLCK